MTCRHTVFLDLRNSNRFDCITLSKNFYIFFEYFCPRVSSNYMISFCDIEKCHMIHYHKSSICLQSAIKSKEKKVACDWDFTYVIVKSYCKCVFWQWTTRAMSTLILRSQFDIILVPTTLLSLQ
jgi:hypothetical protein